MNNKILEHFLQATNEVFQMMFDIEFDFSTPMEAKSLHYDEGHICAEIALLGDIKGTITFKFNADTALDLVEIMCGMEIDEVDEFVKSALGEIANIISGNALTTLSQEEIIGDLEPPLIITQSKKYEENDNVHITVVDATSDIGTMNFVFVEKDQ
ncbi:MAG TPA: chemotaxis protein CheX [Clostridiaceae bacterium]|nr:chemotaxis protein CheX [Clostridiaceae bacterium]HOA30747.1 chemotaxis protein CheX [Clostridia bacterium]